MPASPVTARHSRFCRPCDRDVVARRPGFGPPLALGAVVTGMVIAVLVSSLIGPFIMFAIPFMAIFGFALGPLAMLTAAPATCPECHREVVHRHRADADASGDRKRGATRTDLERHVPPVVHHVA